MSFSYFCGPVNHKSKVVWPSLIVSWFGKDDPTGRSEKRRSGGKTGQEWTFPAQLGQLKTGQDGKGLFRSHLLCTDDLPRLWGSIK